MLPQLIIAIALFIGTDTQQNNTLYADVYAVYQQDPRLTENCKVTEFEIFEVTETSFKIKGIGQPWSGIGVIYKDNTAIYDWVFEDGKRGSTWVTINKHGSIKGTVNGANNDLNWTYIAYPKN